MATDPDEYDGDSAHAVAATYAQAAISFTQSLVSLAQLARMAKDDGGAEAQVYIDTSKAIASRCVQELSPVTSAIAAAAKTGGSTHVH